MKQFVEFIPIALFVAVYFATRDIFLSTGVLMAGLAIQLVLEYLITKQVARRTWVVFFIAIIFGGATLLFRNEVFIQWKPTVVNWFFAGALLGSHFIGKQNLIEKLLGSQLELPAQVWKTLNLGWSLGFFVAGVLNLIVAFYFSMDFWVTYKLVGGFLITTLYMIATITYLVMGGYLKEQLEQEQLDEADPRID
jgi:intracellular septation protein